MMHTASNFIIAYVKSRKLSETYESALLNKISEILDYSNLENQVYFYSDLSEKVMLAHGKLRSARAKASFDDLYKLDYEWFEIFMLQWYRGMLYRYASDRRRHCMPNFHKVVNN